MRPMRRALLGVASLSALLSLTSCSSSGGTTPALVTETQLVEVPVLQLRDPDPSLLVVPSLPPAPTPAIPFGPKCNRKAGCYSNQQLERMLTEALQAYRASADNLRGIQRAINDAKKTQPP